MAQQKFYQKATVQVAIATAIGLIIAALIKEAVSIFEKTTLITGHNEFHDKAMQNLLQVLQE